MDLVPITWGQARAFRLQRMHLDEPLGPRSMKRVVHDLGGVQAQVASAGELQIAVRVHGLKRGSVDHAIYKRKTLVKTWMMRGTIHYLDAKDLPVWAAASATRGLWNKPYWQKYFGISGDQVEMAVELIAGALGKEPLTREQLADHVAPRLKSKAMEEHLRSGWGSVLKIAASQGRLTFGPSEGRNVRFVRPDRWLKDWKMPPHEEAIAEVFRRYLASHGPATRDEFARWWGFRGPDANPVLEAVADDIVNVDRAGEKKALILKKDLKALEAAEEDDEVRALGMFDAYTLAGLPHTEVVPKAHKPKVYRTGAWVSQTFLRGGRVVGTWTHEKKKTGTVVEGKLFKKRSISKAEAEAALERLAPYVGPITSLKVS
jgi:hypothetical protein